MRDLWSSYAHMLLAAGIICIFAPMGNTEDLIGYELILSHQNVSKGVFNREDIQSSGTENVDDPTANTYSIIGQFPVDKRSYREGGDVSGKFQFKLEFYYNNGIVDTLEWKQSSWLTDHTIEGFELVGDITGSDGNVFPLDSSIPDNTKFKGLSRNEGDYAQYSWLDGNGDEYAFFYQSVGCTQVFTKTAFSGIVGMYEREQDGTGFAYGQRLYVLSANPSTDPPSKLPTTEPTTAAPTVSPTSTTSATSSVDRSGLFYGYILNETESVFVTDPYGSFQISANLIIYDEESRFTPIQSCDDCIVWQYRQGNTGVWVDLDHFGDTHLQSTIGGVAHQYGGDEFTTKYRVTLYVGSLRVGDTCAYLRDAHTRVFEPGQTYEMRLTWTRTVDADVLQVTPASITTVETNVLPSGGECGVLNDGNLQVLQPYTVQCSGWSGNDNGNVQFNSMFNNVRLNEVFVDDAADISSVGPPGQVTIMVLIRASAYLDAIACYPIQAHFAASLRTNDEFASDASNLATSTQNRGALSVVAQATVDAANNERMTVEQADAIYVAVTETILADSKAAAADVSADDVTNDFAAVSAIALTPEFISDETVATLTREYLDDRYDAIDHLVANNAVGGDELGSMMMSVVHMLDSLGSTLGDSDTTLSQGAEAGGGVRRRRRLSAADNNALANTIVDRVTECSSIALTQANPGQSVTITSAGTVVSATKFIADNESMEVPPSCGVDAQSIVIPQTFLESQAGNAFDCSFMTSTENHFMSESSDPPRQSNIVSTTMYGESGGRRRRRRLFSPIVIQTDRCFPYLITMALTNTSQAFNQDFLLGSMQSWPSCEFWNVEGTTWNTSGCFVTGITSEYVTCGCTHLTTFSLSKIDILPNANLLTQLDWRRVSVDSLLRYPTVWITCVAALAIFVIICLVNPRSDISESSIIAHEDIIYKSVQEEKLWRDVSGKEIRLIAKYMPNAHLLGDGLMIVSPGKDAKLKLCTLQLKLFKVYLRNEHTLLSVFQRTAGTNYSVQERLGIFFMYLCTVMVATGTFYGVEQKNHVNDVVASFLISLFGTLPGFIAKKLFINSKPKIVKSSKHDAYGSNAGDATFVEKVNVFVKKHGGQMNTEDIEKHVATLYDSKDPEQTIRAVSTIRQLVYDQVFPLPHCCRFATWTFLVLWSVGVCGSAIVYGLQFDKLYAASLDEANPNYLLYVNDCWNTSLQLQSENAASQQEFAHWNEERAEDNASTYGGSDSGSWLLSIGESLLQSLLLWQPLMVYLVTWIKIWAFSWHLKMSIGPGNVIKLCKRCCCGRGTQPEDEDNDIDEMPEEAEQLRLEQGRTTLRITHVIAHGERPMDIISFVGNGGWVIDDREQTEQPYRDADLEIPPGSEDSEAEDVDAGENDRARRSLLN